MLVSPFMKGLYFIHDFYSISIALSILFIVLLVRLYLYKEFEKIKEVWFIVLLPFCYVLSFPFAESPEGAWNELIKWSTYASFFIILYWVSLNKNIKIYLPVIFQITGIMIAFHMILVSFDWIEYRNAIVSERFSGVFQYPNTFGMIMSVFLLFSLVNLTNKNLNIWHVLLYSGPLVLFLTSFIQSYSRGMMLLFPLIWFMALFFFPVKKQLQFVLFSVISGVLSIPIMLIVEKTSNSIGMVSLIILSAMSMGIIFYVKKWLEADKIKVFKKTFIIPISIFVLFLALALDLLYKGMIYQSLPEGLQTRIYTISMNASTAQERMIFTKDAVKMSLDSPIVGFGGEGWSTLYRKYQDTPYISNQTHNGYANWLIDNGWIGLILLLVVVGSFLIRIYKSHQNQRENSLYLAVFLSLIIILIHSFIDFNFSYGTVWFFILWLFVMGVHTHPSRNWTVKMNVPVITFVIFSILVVISFLFSIRYQMAHYYYEKEKDTISLADKINYLENAVAKHPTNIKYLMALLDWYEYAHENQEGVDLSVEMQLLAQKMEDLEPNNSSVLNKIALIYQKIGQKEKALNTYNHALNVDHFNKALYQNSIQFKTNYAMEVREENPKKFLALTKSAIGDFERMEHWLSTFKKKDLGDSFNSREFKMTKTIIFNAALSYFLNEDYEKVLSLYHDFSNKDLNLHALAIVTYENKGQYVEAGEIYDQFENKSNELDRIIDFMKSRYLVIGN